MQIEVWKLIFIVNFSVLDFFKFASRMPQTPLILVSSVPMDPPRFFFFFKQFSGSGYWNSYSSQLWHRVTLLWLLLIGWKVCCTCTRICFAAVPEYIYIYIFFFFFFFFFFFTEVSQLTVAVRWLGTFANILFFEHQNDIFNAISKITK